MDWSLKSLLQHIYIYKNIHIYYTYMYEMKWNEVAQSCPTLCNPMDCSPPGSLVHGIFQAWILEWVHIHTYTYMYIYIKHINYTHTHSHRHTHTLVMFLWRALIQPQSRVYILITTPRIFSWYPWEKMTRVQIRIFQAGWNTLLKEYQLEKLCQCRRKSLGHASGLLTWCCPIQYFCQWLMM